MSTSPNGFEKNPAPSLLSAPQVLRAMAVFLNPVPSSVKPAPQERHEALILPRGDVPERPRAKTSNCSHPLRTTARMSPALLSSSVQLLKCEETSFPDSL